MYPSKMIDNLLYSFFPGQKMRGEEKEGERERSTDHCIHFCN